MYFTKPAGFLYSYYLIKYLQFYAYKNVDYNVFVKYSYHCKMIDIFPRNRTRLHNILIAVHTYVRTPLRFIRSTLIHF